MAFVAPTPVRPGLRHAFRRPAAPYPGALARQQYRAPLRFFTVAVDASPRPAVAVPLARAFRFRRARAPRRVDPVSNNSAPRFSSGSQSHPRAPALGPTAHLQRQREQPRPPPREVVEPAEAGTHALRAVDETATRPLHPVLEVVRRRSSCAGLRERDRRARERGDLTRPKVALCIEGGGMRGAVSAGMVAAIKYCGLEDCFDAVYGCSAGAIVGAYFVSRQLPIYGAQIYYEVLCGPMVAKDEDEETEDGAPIGVPVDEGEGEFELGHDTIVPHGDSDDDEDFGSFATDDSRLWENASTCGESTLSVTSESPLSLNASEASEFCTGAVGSSRSSNGRPVLHELGRKEPNSSSTSGMEGALVPSGSFIDLRALKFHPYFRRLRGAKPKLFYSAKSRPVLHLDYLLNNVVRKQRPLCWKSFMKVHRTQPLRPVATNVKTLKAHTFGIQSMQQLLDALRASARVPGIAGNPVRIGDKQFCDGLLSEPVPFRSALADGFTHVLVLRTKPDDGAKRAKKAPGVYEKHIAGPYFKLQETPSVEAAEYLRAGKHLNLYNTDLEFLKEANRNPGKSRPSLFSIVPPSWQTLGQLECRARGVFSAVRTGFSCAYEALSPFATSTSRFAQEGPVNGDQAARFVFSDEEIAATEARIRTAWKNAKRSGQRRTKLKRPRPERVAVTDLTMEERFFL